MNIKNVPYPNYLGKTTFSFKWLLLPLCLTLFTHYGVVAQKLLDPAAPLTVVTASSGGANSSVAAAYSIRQLKTTYDHAAITAPVAVSGFSNSSTPLLRVKRSSDNGQLDIGYDGNGNLDTVTLKNFVSNNGVNPTANGTVTVWYDQSGNSRDLYPPTTAAEPRIVAAGVVERNSGGQVGFSGINGGMLEHRPTSTTTFNGGTGANIYGINGDRTMNVVSQPKVYSGVGTAGDGAGTYLIDRYGDPNTANGGTPTGIDQPLTSLKAVGTNWALQIRLNSGAGFPTGSFSGSIGISTTRSDNVMVVRSGDIYALYVNGVLAGNQTLVGANDMSPVRIGYGSSTGETVYYGEFILFPSALSSDDLNALNSSQTAYYVLGIPGSNWTGATSTDWATASNWSNVTVPDALASITIPSGTPNAPTINSTVSLKKLTISSGATLTNNGTLNLSDSFTVNGTLTGTGTVVMNGGFQQIISGTTTPIVFANLNISNSINSVVTNNNINVTGTLTVGTGATFAPIATAVINSAGAAGTITGTGTVKVTRVAATPDYQSQYKFSTNTLTNLTVDYAGAGAQNINFTGINYGNLAVSGSGVKALSAAVTTSNVTGNISVTAATLSNNTSGFAIAGNGGRTFSVSNGATFLLSGATSTYPTGFGTFTFGASSTVEYGGTGAQTVVAANYGNLTFSSTGGRTLPAGTVGIAGAYTPSTNTITISTSTLDFNGTGAQTIPASNYYNLTISGARTGSPAITFGSGTVNIANTGSFTATGNTYVVTGNTVNYSKAGTQTVDNDFAYNNLTLSGTSTKTTTGVTVNGVLSLEGDATVVMSAAPTYGASSTLQFNKTAAYTVNNANWPVTFSGTGGVIITGTGAITVNNAKTITYGLSIVNTGQILNLSTFTSTANSLTLGGVGQGAATYGGTTSGCGGVTINATYFANATGCVTTTSAVSTWNGGTSTAWNLAGNWTPSGIPGATTSVIIPSAPVNQPDLNTTAGNCLNLTINSGATLTSSIGLTINGNFVNNGTATLGSSPITIAGSTTQSIAPFTTTGAITISKTAATVTFTGATSAASLTFSGSGSTLSVSSTLNLTGALTLNSAAASNVTAAITGAGTITCASVVVGTTVAPASNQTTALTLTTITLTTSGNVSVNSYFATNRNNATFTHTSGTVNVGGTLTLTTSAAGCTSTYAMGNTAPALNIAGSTPISLTGAGTETLTFNGTGAVVDYNGTSLQTLPAVSITYTAMKVNNTAGVILGANAPITTLTIGDEVANSIFSDGGFTISTVTTLNLTSGTYNIGSATTGNAIPAWGTRNISAGTTVGYVSGVAQTVSATPAYSNLTFTGAGAKTIATGTLSVAEDWSITGGAATFTTTAGATVGGDILGSGNITMGTTGTITIAGAWSNSGTFTKATSTVNYNGTAGQTIAALAGGYHNLTISGARVGAPPIVLASGTIGVSGTFSVTTTGISGYTNTGNTVDYNGTGAQSIAAINYNNLTISAARTGTPSITFPSGTVGIAGTISVTATGLGAYVMTGNTVDYNGGVAQTIGVFNYNNLAISGTRAGSPTITFASGTVGIAGTFSITTTGVSTYSLTGNTINYNATAGAQTVNNTFAYNNLTTGNTSGTQTAAGDLIVNGTLTTTAGGTLSMTGAYTLSGTLGTITNNGTITTSVPTATSATPLASGKTWGGTGTVTYALTTGVQTVVAGTYNNLTLSNTSNTNTAGGSLVVNGILTTATGGTLNMGSANTLTGTLGTITNNGTITTSVPTATSATPLAASKTWGGTGTVTYALTTGVQTVVAGTYNNLILSNTSNTNTAGGSLVVNGTLTTATGGTLDMGSANTLTGTLGTITNNGTITTSVPTATSATPLAAGETWGGTGTVIYALTTGVQTVVAGTYNNLTLSNTSNTNTAGGSLVVNGTLVTTAGGTLDMGTANTLSGTLGTVTNNGTISTAVPTATSAVPIPTGKTWGGTIIYAATAGLQTVVSATAYNNLTLSNTSGTNTAGGNLVVNGTLVTTAGGTLNMGTANTLSGTLGTVTNNGTISTAVPTATSAVPIPTGKTWGGTIIYAATAGLQTVVSATAYNNLTLSNTSGTNTAGGSLVVNGTLVTTAGGTLDMGTANTLSGTLGTVTNNGTISTAVPTATSAVPIPTGKTWGGTIIYAATAGLQTIVNATSYNNLTFSNTSGTNTAGGNIVVNGTLTTATGGTLNMGSANTLTGTLGTITNNGTITTSVPTATSATPLASGKTWGGTGTVTYALTTGVQTVVAGTYNNLILSNTSNTNTAGGSLVVNGTLTTATGGTLDMGSANTLTGTLGTITNNGTITTSVPTATSATPLAAGETWGGTGTVIYALTTGVQTVVAGTYNNLTLSNTSGTNTAGGNLVVNGTLVTTAGGILNMGTANTLSGTLGTVTNNGTISTAVPTATSAVPIPTGKTWGGTIIYAATAGLQTVVSATAYNNLTLSNTSGTNTAGGSLVVNGTLVTTAGGTLDMGTANTLSGTLGTITNNGTISTAVPTATSAVPIPTGKTWGGTIIYAATAGLQTVVSATAYNNLTLSNTSGTNTAGGSLVVNGTLVTTAGGTLDMGTANTLSGTLGTVTNNGTISTAVPTATSAVPIPTGKTWGGTIVYAATAGLQTIVNATSYNNLTFSNTSGTNTAGGNIVVNGILTTATGGTLNMGSANTLTGTLGTIINNGTITTSVPTATSATPLASGKAWGGTGTVIYALTTGVQTVVGGTYNNLTLSNTSNTNTAGGALTVNGTLVTTAGGTLDMGTANILTGTLSTVTNNGTITTAVPTATSAVPIPTGKTWGGTIIYAATAGLQTVVSATAYNNLTLSNTSGTNTAGGNLVVNGTLVTTAGGTLNMGTANTLSGTLGTVTNNGTISTAVPTATSAVPIPTGKTWGGTIIYAATAGLQTVVSATAYNNLTLSNTSGTNTAGGSLVVNGTLVTTAGGTLDMGTANTLSGTLGTITNNGTISTAVPTATSAVPIPTGKTWGGTIVYAATAGLQTIVNATSYNNLTFSNTSGTNTAGGNIVVNGILTTATGGTLNMGSANTLTGTLGTIINNGTITTSVPTATSATPLASGKAWGGTGIVIYALTTGVQTVVGGTYNNLTLSNTSNTNTAGGALTVNGTLVTTAGGTLDMGTANILTGTLSTVTNNGTITTAVPTATSAVPIPTGKTWGGTIIYAATTGLQTVVSATAYNNLTLSNTSGTNTAGGSLVVNGTLVTTAGGTLDMGTANTLSGTLGTVTNNGTISTAVPTATSAVPIPTGKTWGGTIIYAATAGLQTVVSATAYNNLTLSNTSGTNTAGGNLVVNGTLVTTAGGTLNMGTANTLSGTLGTVTNNGTISTAVPTATSAVPIPTGKTWGGTIIYAATAGLQTVVSATAYNNLTLSNTSGTNTAGGSLVVNGTLVTTAGGTLDMGTANTLSGTLGTVTNNGTISTAVPTATSAVPIPTGKTWGGTIVYAATAGLQTVVNATAYNNLTLSNTSGTNTAGGSLVVNGTLVTTAGGTLSMGTANTLSGTLGTITNNGTISTAVPTATSAVPLPSGKNWGSTGTITYNAATGLQTIVAGTYNNLTLSNASGNQATGGNLVVNGTLTTTAGNLVMGTANILSGTLASIVNNGTITTAVPTATNATPIASGKTWGGTGTVQYAATSGLQTVVAGTYNNLSMRNTSGVNTLGGNVIVGANFSFNSAGAKLTLGSNTITFNGDILNMTATTCFTANGSSNIVIGGSGAMTNNLFLDQTTPGTTNRLADLTYNRAAQTITLGDTIEIKGIVTPTAGTLATSNKLKLISDAVGDASIAAGTGSYITGSVTVERYIPSHGRGWRFMASPVAGATLTDWQNEIFITGTGGAANGFDATLSNQGGIYSYDETLTTGDLNTGWVAPVNTSITLTPGKGYRVFIRGDRTPGRLDGTITSQNAVTVNSINAVNTGDINMSPTFTNSGTLANDGWNLLGNPYPCPIDWNAFHNAGRTGTTPDFSGTDYAHLHSIVYVLDAGSGAYTSYNAQGGAVVGDLAGGRIPSGASFWVKASAASPSMTVKEIYKTTTAAGGVFKGSTDNPQFIIKLIASEFSSDETVIRYEPQASNGLDGFDIPKMYGANVNIASIGSDEKFLAANYKPFNGTSDTIRLSAGFAASGSYSFLFKDPNYLHPTLPIYLVDNFKKLAVNVRSNPTYVFDVDINNTATKGNSRFMIVVGETAIPTSIDEPVETSFSYKLYPTVTSGETTILSNFNNQKIDRLVIRDVAGRTQASFDNLEWNNNQVKVDLSSFATGTYFITISNNNGSETTLKCVKQ